MYKYGVEIPRNVEHAFELDQKNKNDFWRKALEKEMTNVGIAFEILPDSRAPPGWSKQTGHLIWDLKMDFTRKARWVLDGHKMPSPIGSMYAGVVSRDSVRIAFTYAALNGLDVCAAISKMLTFRHHLHKSIISFVALSLAWRMLARLPSSIVRSTVARRLVEIFAITCVHVCGILILPLALLIQMSGCALLRVVMVANFMNTF